MILDKYARTQKRKKRARNRKIIVVSALAILVVIIGIAFLASLQPPVTPDIMNKYAQTFIADYNKDLSFFLPPEYDQFLFYSNSSYNLTSIISTTYGVALLVHPANEWAFSNTMTNQRIEDAVFGSNNSLYLTRFNFEDDSGIISPSFSNSMVDIGISVAPGSSIIFSHLTINSVPYFFVILKGNNRTGGWDNSSALTDSRRIFDSDLYYALNSSEEVRERYAEPELNTLLLNVLTKWNQSLQPNGNVTYPYTQKEYDIQQIEELAKTKYGITNPDFVNELLIYLRNVTLPGPKKIFGIIVDDQSDWIYVAVITILSIGIYITYLLFGYVRKQRPESDLKILFEVVGGLLAIGLGDLIFAFPYDYQLLSIQTVVLIIAIVVGLAVVYVIKRKLITWANGSERQRSQ